jgi:phenylacetyl-CoA:acceptor oxidoreductase
MTATRKVPTYCYQCVAGPDLLTVKVEDGVATEVEPNFCAADVHPGGGKVCVKAFGLIQKTYNPNRVLAPMKRSNPKKGRHEDPGFVEISWEEALSTIAGRLNDIRDSGLTDESGYPRVAASFGGGGTPQMYMGSFPAFLSAWGPVDFGMGSGQGVKCYHSEHLYGEFWHRAFIVAADTPLTNYLISCGSNIEASGGVVGIARHAKARVRGMKRVQVEPHLSVTGACSAEWVPIKPKTDPAFLYALIHVMLHEAARERLDLPFLKRSSGSALPGRRQRLLPARPGHAQAAGLGPRQRSAQWPHDTPASTRRSKAASTSTRSRSAPTTKCWPKAGSAAAPPSRCWSSTCSPTARVGGRRVRRAGGADARIANEYLDHACVGQTIDIEGVTLPYRPVAVTLGKTVNNGWGGFECCWARTCWPCWSARSRCPAAPSAPRCGWRGRCRTGTRA